MAHLKRLAKEAAKEKKVNRSDPFFFFLDRKIGEKT